MSDVIMCVGKTNSDRTSVTIGSTSVYLPRMDALWLHTELSRALNLNLGATLRETLQEIAALKKSNACLRGAYTRAKKRRRSRR